MDPYLKDIMSTAMMYYVGAIFVFWILWAIYPFLILIALLYLEFSMCD